MTENDQSAFNAVLRHDFTAFLHRCVLALNPGTQFKSNWHIQAIAYQLERVRRGEVTRLIINLPPRYLKSIMVSVAFPAFLLGHEPRRKITCLSYSADLSSKHAADVRAIVTSDWYRRAFPKMQMRRETDSEIHTSERGYRRATSVYASLTGFGGDCFIIDDPQKPVDAQSDAHRTSLNQWFDNTLISRLDNKETGIIIIVMQRVHLNDLTGYLTETSPDWAVLNLAAIAEADEHIPVGDGNFHFRSAGEALHPEYESLETLHKLRQQVGSDIFSAQYQQSPVPPGGGMIRREWLLFYKETPERTSRAKVIQSWDTASKSGVQNDWSVCTTWLAADEHYYLLDLTRGRFEFPQLRDTAIQLAKRFKPNAVLIEDASAGTALAQDIKRIVHVPVRLIRPEHDKIGRVYVQQAKFEQGLVLFPEGAPFLPELLSELLTFPQCRHDDQVDSLCQALAFKNFGYDTTFSWL